MAAGLLQCAKKARLMRILDDDEHVPGAGQSNRLAASLGGSGMSAREVAAATPLVYIVLLNWNGWKDTIECLESVYRLDYPRFRVIVCDNDSHDGSLDRIKAWAAGELAAQPFGVPLGDAPMRQSKPLAWVEYDRRQAEAGGIADEQAPLVLIRTGGNLGFAGGNNVGLRYAQARGDHGYAWLLNNDTVAQSDALSQMVARMRARPGTGICGSKLIFYHRPDTVQAWGGASYDESRGYVTPLGMFQKVSAAADVAAIEAQMAYAVGASMLVSRELMSEVGLMTEDYFLYLEEIDWACRAKGRYTLAYADASIVYHKEGGSIGSSSTGAQSSLAIHYLYRNRVRFIRRYYRPRFGAGLRQIAFEMLVLTKRRQFRAVRIAVMAVLGELLHGPRHPAA